MFNLCKYTLNQDKLLSALLIIYGLNNSSILILCKVLGLKLNTKLQDLKEENINQIKFYLENKDSLGFLKSPKRKSQLNISRLVEILCYKGIRHKNSLPVHGQRTHSNHKSSKRLNSLRISFLKLNITPTLNKRLTKNKK